jgi:hypothetical protein
MRQRILLIPDAPPSAAIVEKSDATENDAQQIIALRRKIEDKDQTIKQRETRISELEDENRQLKSIPKPAPAPAPAAKPEVKKSSWLWD